MKSHALILSLLALALPATVTAAEVGGVVVRLPDGALQLLHAEKQGVQLGTLTLQNAPLHIERLAKLGNFRARFQGELSSGHLSVARALDPRPIETQLVSVEGSQVYGDKGEVVAQTAGPAAEALATLSPTRTEQVVLGTWVQCLDVRRLVVFAVKTRLSPQAQLVRQLLFDTTPAGNVEVWVKSGPFELEELKGRFYYVDAGRAFGGFNYVAADGLQPGQAKGGGLCDCLPGRR